MWFLSEDYNYEEEMCTHPVITRWLELPFSFTVQRWNVDAFRNVDAISEDVNVFQWTLNTCQ